jgi:hypothetical protein
MNDSKLQSKEKKDGREQSVKNEAVMVGDRLRMNTAVRG